MLRLLALLIACLALSAPATAREPRPLKIARQGSFFIGGQDVQSDTLGEIKPFPQSGHVTVDQVYVRYQIPVRARRAAMVLLHGCCLTGVSWETTPDGRAGWDEWFVRAGHPVYVMDQAWRGRSAIDVTAINAVRDGRRPPSALPVATAASRETAWRIFRFGPAYGETYPGLQFPVEAQEGLWQQMVPNFARDGDEPSPTIAALQLLGERIGRAVIVSHSQSGIYPFEAALRGGASVAGIVAIEPASCPAPDRDLSSLRGIPVLVLFGDYVAQSDRWAPRREACARFVEAARADGVRVELVDLPAFGIRGNSHMMMQDRNSHDVAAVIDRWLRGHGL
ncbi:hypothetical protein [Sphingomonas sp.]|uniref:hypothetical protein n=1 Tax=Sphingomonas sp. TaxID=28214 RepID=UPI002DD63B9A|nr:hypothetical protein [Sphingomonas sp.]